MVMKDEYRILIRYSYLYNWNDVRLPYSGIIRPGPWQPSYSIRVYKMHPGW